MARPDLSTAPAFFHNYINQVSADDLMVAFEQQGSNSLRFFQSIPTERQDFRYAPGKWTIKELLQHLIDAERIFSYRALRFARKDATPLAGFDENLYAATAAADKRDWNELLQEFAAVRQASFFLFNAFDQEQLNSAGTASGKSITVLALGYILIGHCVHHEKIVRERYLVA